MSSGSNIASQPLKQSLLALIPNLRAFAVSLCGDIERADDLVQETLLKAWNHLDSFQEGTNLRAWLFTILRNTYFSECRRRRREVEDDRAARVALQNFLNPLIDMRHVIAGVGGDAVEGEVFAGVVHFLHDEAADLLRQLRRDSFAMRLH